MSEKIPNKYLDGETWDALKAAGFSDKELHEDQPFGPMISSYTRAQAIEDGVLVDLMADSQTLKLVRQAGVKIHTVLTQGAFEAAILTGTTTKPDGEIVFPAGQSLKGRLWDVLMVFRASLKPDTDRCYFTMSVDRAGDGKRDNVDLWALCGPGDQGEPVLTIMLQGED